MRAKIGDGVKLAMMWDNARIHRARIVQQLIATPEVAIEPIWNVTARPDLATVGIEQAWARAKYIYRGEVDRYKALNRPFHHLGLVQRVLGYITDEFAIRLAAHSVPAVMAAQPVAPLPNENLRGEGGAMQQADYSPMGQDTEARNWATFDQGYSLHRNAEGQPQEGVEDAQYEEDIGPHLQRYAHDQPGDEEEQL